MCLRSGRPDVKLRNELDLAPQPVPSETANTSAVFNGARKEPGFFMRTPRSLAEAGKT